MAWNLLAVIGSNPLDRLSGHEGEAMFALVVALGVLCYAVITLTRMYMKHRERIAMIHMGIHPDHPPAGENAALKETADYAASDGGK